MRLTTASIRSIALPEGVSDKVFFDASLPGFGLRVRASGVQTWLVQYAVGGRTRRMSLGAPATVDPGKAREAAKDILAQVRLGHDPAAEKQTARTKAADTLGALIPKFLQHQRARLRPRTLDACTRHLAQYVRDLHPMPVTTIDRRTVAIQLSELASARGPATANRVRSSLSSFFSWAIREGFIENNPVVNTGKAAENGSRRRVLSDDELAVIWRCLGADTYASIVRLLMLTGGRREEIGNLRWDIVDLAAALIALPPERTKNKREHAIPLSAPVCAILMARSRTGESVFGRGGGNRGFQNWSLAKAELDARITATLGDKPLPPWTLHDIRRSLSTAMHERFGVPPHVVEALLGHVGLHRSGVAGVYNKAVYLEERRRALERWAGHVVALAEGGGNVISIAS